MEEKKIRPYKLKVRTFLKDGVPTYQTVATKGKEVIPFWYNGDIIYLGLGSSHPQHDRDWKIVQECLNAEHGLGYPYAGTDLAWSLENAMERFGYKRDEFITRDLDDLTIEYPLILSRKTVEMLDNQKFYSKISEFASIGHYAKRKA